MLRFFNRKPITPQEVADHAERILNGNDRGLDVDLHEHMNLKDASLKDLHIETLRFGLPERWAELDDAKKSELRAIIEEMRRLGSSSL